MHELHASTHAQILKRTSSLQSCLHLTLNFHSWDVQKLRTKPMCVIVLLSLLLRLSGKMIGAFCALSGVFILSLPIPIVVSSFANCYKNRLWRVEVEAKKAERLLDNELLLQQAFDKLEGQEKEDLLQKAIAAGYTIQATITPNSSNDFAPPPPSPRPPSIRLDAA